MHLSIYGACPCLDTILVSHVGQLIVNEDHCMEGEHLGQISLIQISPGFTESPNTSAKLLSD